VLEVEMKMEMEMEMGIAKALWEVVGQRTAGGFWWLVP
jgi:hypothetical protein